MKRLLKEPLLHFLLLGAGFFVVFNLTSGSGGDGEPGEIVIDRGQLASMMELFIRTRQRAPTAGELEGLIRDRVREEVYYREALALGLDQDDIIIRRRLAQKMEFISEDVTAETPPSDAELHDYLQAHPDRFLLAERYTFRQVYLDPGRRGRNLSRDVAQLLQRLNRPGGDSGYETLGDPFMLGHRFTGLPAGEILKQFGKEFTSNLAGLQPGRWEGPVASGFGVHLVSINERVPARLPELAEVRESVLREWNDDRRLEANEKFYRELLKHYTVTIDTNEAP